jgi:hypothetical protein
MRDGRAPLEQTSVGRSELAAKASPGASRTSELNRYSDSPASFRCSRMAFNGRHLMIFPPRSQNAPALSDW